MNKRVLFFVIACSIAARGAQVNKAAKSAEVQGAHSPRSSSAPSGERIGPQSFEGTWQGVCYGYGALNQEPGSQSSLTVMLTVKAARAGKLSAITSTGPWQHQPIQTPRPSPGEPPPPPAPRPLPLPASPPGGKISNPRTEGRTLEFEVKGPGRLPC